MAPVPTYHDFFGWLSTATQTVLVAKDVLGQWSMHYVFPPIAVMLVGSLGVKVAISHPHDHGLVVAKFAMLLATLAINFSILFFWINPFPGVGMTLPGVLGVTADKLDSAISDAKIEQLVTDLQTRGHQVDAPAKDDASNSFAYYGYRGLMLLFEGAAFLVIMFAYGGFALGTLLAPIFIPLGLLQTTSSWFSGWLRFTVKFCLMRVVASAVLLIVSQVVYFAFSNIPWYLYIIDLENVLPFLAAVLIACLYFVFKIPALTSELFGGGSDAVSGLGSWMANTANRALNIAAAL